MLFDVKKSGTSDDLQYDTIALLPEGFRPSVQFTLPIEGNKLNGTTAAGAVHIKTNGELVLSFLNSGPVLEARGCLVFIAAQ